MRLRIVALCALVGCTAANSEPTDTGEPRPDPMAGDTPTVVDDPTPPASPPAQPPAPDSSMAAIWEFIQTQSIDTSSPDWKTQLLAPPEQPFPGDRSYFWNLITSEGPIKIRLMPDVAPMHVTSTIFLTELGFYDGLTFHRVIPGFMAQGGCPMGNGRGNPGYRYAGEFSPRLKHDRPGLLSMANAGPNTDGSQFFITFVPTPHLDGKHTIFGEVVQGMDTVWKIEAAGSSGRGTPTRTLSIQNATITVE